MALNSATLVSEAYERISKGDIGRAERLLNDALRVDPGFEPAYHALGGLLRNSGRFDDALAIAKQANELWPRSAYPLFLMASCRRVTTDDATLIHDIESALDAADGDPRGQILLHYALGKAHDDRREFSEAIEHFDAANALSNEHRRLSRPFSRSDLLESYDQTIAGFSAEPLSRVSELGSLSEVPIFIVGMVRSGTTLLDQVLSAHPDVGSIGETPFWFGREAQIARFAAMKGQLAVRDAKVLASSYLDMLRKSANGKSRVIDKMPNNYIVLGLIRTLFPAAKIIHCTRQPVDNCISIYTTPFADPPRYAHDRRNIVEAFKLYQHLMAHWERVIPSSHMTQVSYEDLVCRRESTLLELMPFLGLEWSDSCLHHELNSRVVNTPSVWQVRQPVYSSSIGRWRNYEPWLGPFQELIR